MIALGPIFQAVGAVVDLIIEAVENFSDSANPQQKPVRKGPSATSGNVWKVRYLFGHFFEVI